MAVDFSDPNAWGITPDQAVASRKKALDSYQNVAEPALKEKQGLERGQMVTDVYKQAANVAQSGNVSQMSGLMGQAQAKAAELVPTQGKEADASQLLGAQAKQDLIGSRQDRAISNYTRNTEEQKVQAADYITKRAFDMGITSKQLMLHQNAYIAERGLDQLYSDLQAGRENEAEIRQLSNQMEVQAKQSAIELQKMQAQLMSQLELDIANKNLDAAKARTNKMMELMKKAAEDQAKSNALKGILGGIMTVGGAVVGGIYGGPAGAAGGAALGETGAKLMTGSK